ncbi:MAG: AMP-binding protein [Thermodesulfobacteriota bacterium]|nr:AMP-binding protein [Thermodesulfobacteriota bacterium]
MGFNKKAFVRRYAGYINFRNQVRLLMHWMPRANRVFVLFEGRAYTYKEVYEQSVNYATLFLAERNRRVSRGLQAKDQRLCVGIYQENTPEYIFAILGAGLSNSILFAVNTGFRGSTLANVINQAGISLMLTNPAALPQLERALPEIHVPARDNILITEAHKSSRETGYMSIEARIEGLSGKSRKAARKSSPPIDNTTPVMVIYTSGTTGLPKGVPCTHLKLFGAGMVVQNAAHLKKTDRGYICMPLFHSNALFVGLLPIMIAGGSFVLKRKFSATAFAEDIFTHGITYMNYVGQPLHYILAALEKQYGSGDAVEKALGAHPDNKFRIAYGNGASAVDRGKMMRYLNMEHIYELYGSTEAVITTVNKPGDPVESLGRVGRSVIIIDEENNECEPGIVNEDGQLINYEKAVGEISKRIDANDLRFDGYYGNEKATCSKVCGGFYHSGDIGHIRIVNGRRYLFFNGRTDDWIRKDGENFSAENVLAYAAGIPGVKLAIAYGVPCEVSDEKVMAAVQLQAGETFAPRKTFDWLMAQQAAGGMDPKWMPDYIRIVDAFTLTNTQKILIRPFKHDHFNIEANPDMNIYFRQRGDTTYHQLTPEAYQAIKQRFVETGREALLYHA